MNSERSPGAGRGMTGVAAPVRRVHLPEIVVAHIGVQVQNAAKCSASEKAAHLFHRGLVAPLVPDAEHAAGLFACCQNPLRTGGCKRERLLAKDPLTGC